jgi:hypothetical protein
LSLAVFESDASKPDSALQFVFMLYRNKPKNNPHTRSPPIDSEVSNGDLKQKQTQEQSTHSIPTHRF